MRDNYICCLHQLHDWVCHSGKAVLFGVRAKKSTKCGRANILGLSPPTHVSTTNHKGLIVSMEAKIALEPTT